MQMASFSLDAKMVCVDLMEVCTRFHIMIEHRCCELGLRNLPMNDVKFDSKMNMDMLTQVGAEQHRHQQHTSTSNGVEPSTPRPPHALPQGLSGVMSLYDDLRGHGIACDNEAEFRAYFIVSSADPEMVSGKLRQLPAHVRNAPPMQTALRILASVQNNDPTSFFRELRKADYLTACLMHKHIDQVRERGLQARERHPRARLSSPSLPHPPDFSPRLSSARPSCTVHPAC